MADQNTETPRPPLTQREALRQIWLADKYPCLGNEDWRVAEILSAEALERAGQAVPTPDDLPEFAEWIAALRNPNLPGSEHDRIMYALHDFFDPEVAEVSAPGAEEE